MKLTNILLFFCLSLFTLSGCYTEYYEIDNNEPDESFFMDVGHLNGVYLDVNAEVIIVPGNGHDIEIVGQRSLVDELILENRSGVLRIDLHGNYNYRKLRIYISMDNITEVTNDASGNIHIDGGFGLLSKLEITNKGSGEIYFDAAARVLDVLIDGSGDVILGGNTKKLKVYIDGSGDLEAFRLRSDEVFLITGGSGNAEVFARYYLEVLIDGSGDVFFRGSPDIDYDKQGSGDLYDDN